MPRDGRYPRLNKCPLFFDTNPSDFACMSSDDESTLHADDAVLVYKGTTLKKFSNHVYSRF